MLKRSRRQSFSYTRRLHVEPLEDRRLLAVYTVDSLADNLDDDGLTTLREAVIAANADTDADEIRFASELFDESPQTIDLALLAETSTSEGDSALKITSSLTITGPGADLLTIDASSLDGAIGVNDGEGARLFRIDDGSDGNLLDVEFSGLTLTGGDVVRTGGAIRSVENLSLTGVVISNNFSAGEFIQGGGGIYQTGGQLTLTGSQISQNATSGSSGGIFAKDADVSIVNSTLSENSANIDGGIYLYNCSSVIDSSTISQNSADVSRGGGISVYSGSLILRDSFVTQNVAGTGENNSADGGGVFATEASLTIDTSEIRGNEASRNGGGVHFGTFSSEHSLVVINSKFEHNVTNNGDGGGLFLDFRSISGPLTFARNLIDDNSAAGDGGGLYLRNSTGSNLLFQTSAFTNNQAANGGGITFRTTGSGADQSMFDCVVSGNSATGYGGGIHASARERVVRLQRTTITNNRADADSSGSGVGDGVMLQDGTLIVTGSIIADNNSYNDVAPDVGVFPGASLNATYSLIGSNQGNALVAAPVGFPDASGNLIGDINDPINAHLAPLSYYGGALPMHALLPESPAVDAGDPSSLAGVAGVPEFDLRGAPYVRIFDGDGNKDATVRIDMGSFELQDAILSSPLIVDTLTDENDGEFSAGSFSLREALAVANSSLGSFVIQFSPELAGETIVLQEGQLFIARSVEIEGLGSDRLTIDGEAPALPPYGTNAELRLFNIDDGTSDLFAEVSISGLTLSGGTAEQGGGILLRENLALHDVKLVNNQAYQGGGIHAAGGTLTISDSTIASNHGAGIFTVGSAVSLDRTSILDNFGTDFFIPAYPRNVGGAGVHVESGSLTVSNSTIRGNIQEDAGYGFHPAGGAGIAVFDADAIIRDSLFDENILNSRDFFGSSVGGGGLAAIATRYRSYPPVEPTLLVERSIFLNNLATYGDTGRGNNGGGVFTYDLAEVNLTEIKFIGNKAARGGGAFFSVPDAFGAPEKTTVSRSYFEQNQSIAGHGGGLYAGNVVTVRDSTFVQNHATTGYGGGIYARTLHLTNSTLTENSADYRGGAIWLDWSSFQGSRIANSTIVKNHAGQSGGGVDNGRAVVTHSIIAGNTKGNGLPSDAFQFQSIHHSFIGHNAGSSLTETGLTAADANGNYIGGDIGGDIDPLLEPLADNGGPTLTMMPRVDSPVLDAGDLAFKPNDPDGNPSTDDGLPYDQRGFPYRRVADGNAPTDVVIDIGAVERQPQPADFNSDLAVDGFDFLSWQRGYGATSGATLSDGDANSDGAVDAIDLSAWQATYGQGDTSEVPPARLVDVAGVARLQADQPDNPQSSPTRLASRADLFDAALAIHWSDRPQQQSLAATASTVQSESSNDAIFAREFGSFAAQAAPAEPASATSQPEATSEASSLAEIRWLADELLESLCRRLTL